MGNDLTRRVRENTTPAATENGERENGQLTLGQQIQHMEAQFQRAMPRGAEAAQLVRDALTLLRMNPKIGECQPASVLGALMTCAQLGLRPNVPGLGHAWVLPFWDKNVPWLDEKGRKRFGGFKAQLILGYQGYRELAQRSGQIATVIGRVVYANDLFEIDYGIADDLIHKPKLDGPRGEAIGYYAIVKYTSGGYAFWHMSKAEVEEHRDRYAMAKNKQGEVIGPWRDNFDEMAVKTAFLRLAKWMPKNTELAAAIEADGSVRVDLTPDHDAMMHGERPALPAGDDAPGQVIDVPEDEPEPAPEPPVEDEPPAEEPPADVPMPNKNQLTKLHATLNELGVKERKDKLQDTGVLIGRKLTSSSELTLAEFDKVIAILDRCAQDPEPAKALDFALANASEGGES